MSLHTYQAVKARLATDPGFSAEVQRRGSSALPEDLTPTERADLLAAAVAAPAPAERDPGAALMARVGPLLPLTCAVVPADLLRGAAGAFATAQPLLRPSAVQEAIGFCGHLLSDRSVREASPFVREVVEYERAVLDLRQAAAFGRAAPVYRVEFEHELRPLVGALVAGGSPDGVPLQRSVLEGYVEHGSVHWRRAASA